MNDTPPRKSGLAVTSLVLGILSVLGCTLFTGIPAIICGIIARTRARKTPESHGGDGLALGGIITGSIGSVLVFVFTIPFLAGMLVPAVTQARGRAQSINCVNNMKQILLGTRIFATDNKDVFPPNFLTMSNELSSPTILICPSDTTRTRMTNWSQFSPNNVTYIYSGADLKEELSTMQKVIITCPIHGHVGLGDGSVQQGTGGGRGRKGTRP